MLSYVPILHAAVLAAAAIALLAAAWHDARSFRIPNIYCLIILLLFPAMALTAPEGVPINWTHNIAIFAIVLAAGMALNHFKLLGGGDAKLIAALSLWPGPSYILQLLFFIAIAGGLMVLCLAFLEVFQKMKSSKDSHQKQSTKEFAKTPMPYGIPIFIGGIVMLAHMAQTHEFLPVPVTG